MLGAWAEPHLISGVHGAEARAATTVIIILGSALVFLVVGEYIGIQLKYRALPKKLHKADNGLGGLLSAASLLVAVWLIAYDHQRRARPRHPGKLYAIPASSTSSTGYCLRHPGS